MPASTASSYYRQRIWINNLSGGVVENYNLGNITITEAIPIAQTIVTYRGLLLAAGAAIVNAVISLEQYSANAADGVRFPTSQLSQPEIIKKINNSTTESTIEAYADPSQGLLVTLPTATGQIEKRLLRMVRASWIANNQFQGVGVIPMSSATYGALLASFPAIPTLPQLLGVFFSYVRDNTVLVQRGPSTFTLIPFSNTSPNWQIQGIGKRAIGYAWPPVKGRAAAYAA